MPPTKPSIVFSSPALFSRPRMILVSSFLRYILLLFSSLSFSLQSFPFCPSAFFLPPPDPPTTASVRLTGVLVSHCLIFLFSFISALARRSSFVVRPPRLRRSSDLHLENSGSREAGRPSSFVAGFCLARPPRVYPLPYCPPTRSPRCLPLNRQLYN